MCTPRSENANAWICLQVYMSTLRPQSWRKRCAKIESQTRTTVSVWPCHLHRTAKTCLWIRRRPRLLWVTRKVSIKHRLEHMLKARYRRLISKSRNGDYMLLCNYWSSSNYIVNVFIVNQWKDSLLERAVRELINQSKGCIHSLSTNQNARSKARRERACL